MGGSGKPLVWLEGEIKTPPFSLAARLEAGFLLRQLQQGANIGMPHSRPLPAIGPRCYELRIDDAGASWRIVYRADFDAILILDVFKKKSPQTPKAVISACRRRIRRYDGVSQT